MLRHAAIVVIAALALLTALAIILANTPEPSGPKVLLSLECYTNTPSLNSLATFRIKNADAYKLTFSSWAILSASSTERLDARFPIKFLSLEPGASRTFVIEVPPHCHKWKISSSIVIRQTLRERLRPFLGNYRLLRRWFGNWDVGSCSSEWYSN